MSAVEKMGLDPTGYKLDRHRCSYDIGEFGARGTRGIVIGLRQEYDCAFTEEKISIWSTLFINYIFVVSHGASCSA